MPRHEHAPELFLADLVPPGHLGEARLLRGRLAPAALAAELLRRRWVTSLQARWLAHGRAPVVGPYVLVRRLGHGGMGHVHLARHRHLRREVALKTQRPRADADGRGRARFLREAEALGRADHPNVVHCHDAGEDRGVRWLALEYVPGPDLGALVAAEGPLGPGRACSYARQAALGLAHLHERGLVHRDVKPGNLALAARGRVKVLDVGLARHRSPAGSGSGTKLFTGTVDYAAPEQVVDARRVGPKADQYALGAALFFLLTGSVPFPGGTPSERAARRLVESPLRLPGLPGGLAGVVGRLLSLRARDRFPSMADAASALAVFSAPAAAGDTGVAPALTGLDLPALPGDRRSAG